MCWLLLVVVAKVPQERCEIRKESAGFQARKSETVQKPWDFAGLSFYPSLVTGKTKGI